MDALLESAASSSLDPATLADIFPGDSEMAQRMRELDWANTPLGTAHEWPQSLRTSVSTCLNCAFPIILWWGPDLTILYNDEYKPILGPKHPAALGRAGAQVWAEVWDVIGPMLSQVMTTEEATRSRDMLLHIDRGTPEEAYFSFSYSPIRAENGQVGGVFCPVIETTQKVIGERRLRTLRDLAAECQGATREHEAYQIAARILGANPYDVPFALLYRIDAERSAAVLVATAGMDAGTPASPSSVPLNSGHPPLGSLSAIALSGKTALLTDPTFLVETQSPRGAWKIAARNILAIPILAPGQDQPRAILVTAASPLCALDADYRTFFELIATQIASGLANAQALETERRNGAALAELDRAKTTFFSNVSHEFRTPLTLLLGPLQDATERPAEGLRGEALESAHRNALRLLKLVNTLLDFSRIQSNHAVASYVATDLRAVTEDLASGFTAALDRAGLRYTVTCHAFPEPVFVDRDMWEKIVLNLLSNAFKYTFEGEIRVELTVNDAHAQLLVADTGVGIPADALPHLFERFYRVPGTQGRTHEGSGIGLSLVKELVALHEGTIDVDSTPGRGSEFRVRIPLGAAHLPQERVRVQPAVHSAFINAQAFAAESERWLPDVQGNTGSFPTLSDKSLFPTLEEKNTPAATVLVVDDNADMRDYVSRLLGSRFSVVTATDGEAALELLKTGIQPDLVLSDVMMPRLDGAGLLQAIRGNPDTRDLPVILLSARAGEEATIEGLASGADDYLVKPFSARELVARVDTHVRLTRLRRDAHQRVQTVLNSITDGLLILNRDWRYTYVSDQASRMLNIRPDQMLGACVWDLFPQAKETNFYQGYHHAMETGQPVHFEEYYPQPLNQWLECHCYPSPEGLSVYFRDITARKEDEQKLRQSQEVLQATDRRKDEFLATLAHELRNPLAPIRTAARILATADMTQEQLASCARIIQRQAQSMALLLDDLLDLSRISSNKLQLKKQLITVSGVIHSAVETARPIIDARGHALSLNLPDKPITVDADPLRLAQVITNLLTNAAKYTDSNGRIEVSAVQRDTEVEITVRDNGIGLSAEDAGRVFEMFSQVDSALDRAQGGLGIGLALVRGIVELHGGEVLARSEGLSKGSEFVIKLPLAGPSDTVDVIALVDDRKTSRHRILVADDNLDARDTMRMLLELSGHEVRAAGNGQEALGMCAAWRPDLAILDIGMPELNGYEIAERLRREAWGKEVILVALSGWGDEKNIQQARAAGFDRHLTKPVDLDKLEQLIGQLLTKPLLL